MQGLRASGLFGSTLTLLAGGVLAQALPLLLGPLLTRVYTPTEYGHFSLIWTVASNLAVIGCARYEFALPLELEESGAALLLGLCTRVLACMLLVSVVVAGILVLAKDLPMGWWLPLAVLSSAATQALTLWATKANRFTALAWARVTQWGGGAALQVLMAPLGLLGLLLGPIVAGLAASGLLLKPSPAGGWRGLLKQAAQPLRAMARKHRDFPLLNTPHAFAGALQDSLALLLIAAWNGDAAAGFWALALRYLKAPASLVGGALSQTLYPRLATAQSAAESRALIRNAMIVLMALALPLAAVLMLAGPWLFQLLFGESWAETGLLARALAVYVALHFVASPLSVATMAWGAQAWALKLALVGQAMFVVGLATGLYAGGLVGAGWGVSAAMLLYFGYFFWALPHKAVGGQA